MNGKGKSERAHSVEEQCVRALWLATSEVRYVKIADTPK